MEYGTVTHMTGLDRSGDNAVPQGGGEAGADAVASDRAVPTVLVIGAGVSGCACAATLAAAGSRVTLINSAMDRVGLPAYGPDLVGPGGRWDGIEDTMASLPSPLRAVWVGAGMRPVCGGAVMNVDRRRVSVETKRLLELMPGLQFRQGFVADLRAVAPTTDGDPVRVQVETIFGEVFEADAAVVAVGLSLGGLSSVGADTVEGGRYGEPASDGLFEALEGLGAEFRKVVLKVGLRGASRDYGALAGMAQAEMALAEVVLTEMIPGPAVPDGAAMKGIAPTGIALEGSERTGVPPEPGSVGVPEGAWAVAEAQAVAVGEDAEEWAWPADYPPGPHLDPALRLQKMVVAAPVVKSGEGAVTGEFRPLVSPDGAATSEVYVAPTGFAPYVQEAGQGVARRTGADADAAVGRGQCSHEHK